MSGEPAKSADAATGGLTLDFGHMKWACIQWLQACFFGKPSLLEIIGVLPEGRNKENKKEVLQGLKDAYAGPWAIVDLAASAWLYTSTISRCCSMMRQKACERGEILACAMSDTAAAVSTASERGCTVYLCHAGLLEFAIPIYAYGNGQREWCASFIGGQFRPTSLEIGFLLERADALGLDRGEFVRAVQDLPPLAPEGDVNVLSKDSPSTRAPAWSVCTVKAVLESLKKVQECLTEYATLKGNQIRIGFAKEDLAALQVLLNREARGEGFIARAVRAGSPLVHRVAEAGKDRKIVAWNFLFDSFDPEAVDHDKKKRVEVGFVHRATELSRAQRSWWDGRLMWSVSGEPQDGNGDASLATGILYTPLTQNTKTAKYWNKAYQRKSEGRCWVLPAHLDPAWTDLGMHQVSLQSRAFVGGNSSGAYHIRSHRANPVGEPILFEAFETVDGNGQGKAMECVFRDCPSEALRYADAIAEGAEKFTWWTISDTLAQEVGHWLCSYRSDKPVAVEEMKKAIRHSLEELNATEVDQERAREIRGPLVSLFLRLDGIKSLKPQHLLAVRSFLFDIPVEHGTTRSNALGFAGNAITEAGLPLIVGPENRGSESSDRKP